MLFRSDCLGIKQGGVVNLVLHAIGLSVPADNIPEAITVDISKLEIGDSIHVSSLKLPGSSRLAAAADVDATVVTLAPPLVEPEPEPETLATTAAPAGAEDAEGEATEASDDSAPEA